MLSISLPSTQKNASSPVKFLLPQRKPSMVESIHAMVRRLCDPQRPHLQQSYHRPLPGEGIFEPLLAFHYQPLRTSWLDLLLKLSHSATKPHILLLVRCQWCCWDIQNPQRNCCYCCCCCHCCSQLFSDDDDAAVGGASATASAAPLAGPGWSWAIGQPQAAHLDIAAPPRLCCWLDTQNPPSTAAAAATPAAAAATAVLRCQCCSCC